MRKFLSESWLTAAFAAITTGCVHHLPAAVSTSSINPAGETPVGFVTGKSEASYFLGMGPFGDDSLRAALENAKAKAPSDTMMNVFVDRKVFCFPFCALPIYVEVETSITGTLVKYRDLPATAPGQAAQLPAPLNAPTPLEGDSPEVTYGKMFENFSYGQPQAERFHLAVPGQNQVALKEFIIRQKGNGSGWNWKLRFDAAMTPKEREMLEWYVKAFTDYSPKFDR